MHIVSWNVAGLSTTLQRIHSDYGASSLEQINQQPGRASKSASIKPPRCHAFSYFLQRHGIDILCIQEHKIPLKQLSSRAEPMGCSSVPGYEAFFSCCNDNNSKGLNGVCTYAKEGTVISADAKPLGDEKLDSQGRCIKTDHGSFIIFNVYVPQGGTCGISYKLGFLQKLRAAMQKCRATSNKRIILVGDMNISHESIDVFWKRRRVSIDRVLKEVEEMCDYHASDGEMAPDTVEKWKIDIAKNWNTIIAALETKRVVEKQTTNPATGEKFDKFCAVVTVNNKDITLGKAEACKDDALSRYDLSPCYYFDEEKNLECLLKESNVICLDVLTELISKICGVEWNWSTQYHVASCTKYLYHESPTIDWLKSLVEDDQMVDAFRLFYPTAKGRFTCWNQYTNSRYFNEGSRIDYTLVDKDLAPYIRQGSPLRCGSSDSVDPNLEEAALIAATANGGFKAASFDGSGIGDAEQEVLDSQFGPLHTGMIYTPPSYSDHIAVSLLLIDDNGILQQKHSLDETDRATRGSQPHKSQSSITSFFSAGAGNKGLKRSADPIAQRPSGGNDEKSQRNRKNTLQRWLQPKK